jgi:hypothetical protein
MGTLRPTLLKFSADTTAGYTYAVPVDEVQLENLFGGSSQAGYCRYLL